MHDAFMAKHLTVNYEDHPVLFDVSFTIPRGKLVGMIGPNGAGKSTLIKAATGLVKASSGEIKFFGESFKKMRKKIAYVPQRSSVDWDFPITAEELVMMGKYGTLGLFKRPSKEDRLELMRTLETLGMLPFRKRQISKLSGGQQQRLFIARALMQNPELFLLDEPFAGVDLCTERLLIEVLKDLARQGKTLLVVHHDLCSVREYFDHIVLLNTSLVASGEVQQVFTEENISRTYSHKGTLFEEAMKLSLEKISGLK